MQSSVFKVGLVLSLFANAGLAVALVRTYRTTIPKVKRQAWKGSCPKIAIQHLLYDRALAHARREGKQLVVIGNPTGGWVNKVVTAYGCGDVCIDLMGCSPCEPGARVLKQDATVALKTLPDNSAVVFESGVFELVGDMTETVKQLDRVTGGDISRIYAVHDINLDAWAYHNRGVRPSPPSKDDLARRRKNRLAYARTGEGMAKRIIYRFPPRDRYAWSDL